MSDLQDEKEIIKLERYFRREGREEFVTEMRNANRDQLDSKMLALAKHNEVIKDTKQNDDQLKAAKVTASVLGAPYREQENANKKMARFITLLRKEKGLE